MPPSEPSALANPASPDGTRFAVASQTLRNATLWPIAAAIVASLPSLFVGFSNDDLTHRLMLEGRVPSYAGGWLGLYDFTPPSLPAPALIDQGLLPWFSDPALKLRFLRPLSSATLALDAALFDRNALLAHIHSLLWMLVLVWMAAQLYRRWFAAPAALLSSLVFAVSGVHAIPMGWLASRHTLVAATLGLSSLWAWVRYREDHVRSAAPLAAVLLGASLLSSESGLVAVLLLAGHDLAGHGLKRSRVRRGLPRAALPLGIGLTYLAAYVALGYGTRASGFYVSPFDAPFDYAAALFWNAPALVAELLLGVPSVVAGLGGRPAQVVLWLLAAGASAGTFFLMRNLAGAIPAAARRTLAWLLVASLLGLGALVGALASGRVLPLPLFAAAALGGHALWGAWSRARAGRKRWWLAVAVVAAFQLGLPLLVRVAVPGELARGGERQRRLALDADLGPCATGGSLYLVNGSDPTLTLYGAAALAFYTPEKARAQPFRALSMAPQAQRVTRTAPGTLQLNVLDPPRRSTAFERLFRAADQPLAPGLLVALPELDVHVDETSEGLFTAARFEFREDLNGSRRCLLLWRDGRLQHVPMPGVGESLQVAHEAGPMGL